MGKNLQIIKAFSSNVFGYDAFQGASICRKMPWFAALHVEAQRRELRAPNKRTTPGFSQVKV